MACCSEGFKQALGAMTSCPLETSQQASRMMACLPESSDLTSSRATTCLSEGCEQAYCSEDFKQELRVMAWHLESSEQALRATTACRPESSPLALSRVTACCLETSLQVLMMAMTACNLVLTCYHILTSSNLHFLMASLFQSSTISRARCTVHFRLTALS